MKSVSDIEKEIKALPLSDREQVINSYKTDTRVTVIKMLNRFEKEVELLNKEHLRLESMKEFEYKFKEYKYICGIDEAGRGPLAGPVVAGAVILPSECEILYLNDSKKLSAKKREELFNQIVKEAVAYGIGIVNWEAIDEVNILQATYLAMHEAINKLSVKPDILLNDAVNIPNVDIKQVAIIKGDTRSISIAAASIIAKVTRDDYMMKYDEIYPEYGFARHKGYGTSEHINAIKKFGPCPIHRMSFIKNFLSD